MHYFSGKGCSESLESMHYCIGILIRNFVRKLHKILAIIFNRDYVYAEAIFSKEDFEKFREYINSFAVHKENSTDVVDNQ